MCELKTLLRPIGQRVLIEPMPEIDKIGSIFIPQNAREKTLEGHVRQIGTGAKLNDGTRRPFGVAIGDKVLFAKFGGTELHIGGKVYKLVHEDDVMAVLVD